jgi:hypothetical protein
MRCRRYAKRGFSDFSCEDGILFALSHAPRSPFIGEFTATEIDRKRFSI